jgi:hypothetical protein
VEFEAETEVLRGLLCVGRGLERQSEGLAELKGGEALVVLELDALGAVGGDGDDPGAEGGGGFGVRAVALSGFEEPGVDGLEASLIVDLFGALAFEDDGGDADGAVPGGEVGDGAAGGEGEDVGAFLDFGGVVGEDLGDEDAGVAVVDGDGDRHLLEREDGGVGLLLVARDEDAGVGAGEGVRQEQGEGEEAGSESHGNLPSAMCTMPF